MEFNDKVNLAVKKLLNFLQKYPNEIPLFYKGKEQYVKQHLKLKVQDEYFYTDVYATVRASLQPLED